MLACTIWQKYDREQMEQQLIIKVWQEMCPDLATTPPLMHPNPVWQKNGKSSSFQTWNVFVEIEDSIACQTFVWPSQHRFKYRFVRALSSARQVTNIVQLKVLYVSYPNKQMWSNICYKTFIMSWMCEKDSWSADVQKNVDLSYVTLHQICYTACPGNISHISFKK